MTSFGNVEIVPTGGRPLPSLSDDSNAFAKSSLTQDPNTDSNFWHTSHESLNTNATDWKGFPIDELLHHIQKLFTTQDARIKESISVVISQALENSSPRIGKPRFSSVSSSKSVKSMHTGSSTVGSKLAKQSSVLDRMLPTHGSRTSHELDRLLSQEQRRSDATKHVKGVFSSETESVALLSSNSGQSRKGAFREDRPPTTPTTVKKQATIVSQTSHASSKAFSVKASLHSNQWLASGEDSRMSRKKTKVSDEMQELTRLANEIHHQGHSALRNSTLGAITANFSMKEGLPKVLFHLMNSRPVELLISVMIVLNAVVIGVQVDDQMRNPADGGGSGVGFRIFDIFFLSIFTLELLLRIAGERFIWFLHWRNEKFSWNVFDSILVVSAFGEEVMTRFLDSTPDVSTLRLFRILRLVRVFRIIRVMRFFRDLRVMVSGIAQSMQSLIWALLLLFCIMYLVAVCVMQIAVEESENRVNSDADTILSDDQFDNLQNYFGSLVKTLYTLYLSITGGVDWGDAADPLFGLTWALGIFFGIYIAFSVLCVLNIVTGVFVENCNKMTAQDQDMVLMEQLENRRQWFEEVRGIFDAADTNDNGSLDAVEFVEKLAADVRMQAWLRKLGVHIEAHSANNLFILLDLDGDGQLDFDEFAIALQQLHGQARSIDLARIKHDTKHLRSSQADLYELCHEIYEKLDRKDNVNSDNVRNEPQSNSATQSTWVDEKPKVLKGEPHTEGLRLAESSVAPDFLPHASLPGEIEPSVEDSVDNPSLLDTSRSKARSHVSTVSLH